MARSPPLAWAARRLTSLLNSQRFNKHYRSRAVSYALLLLLLFALPGCGAAEEGGQSAQPEGARTEAPTTREMAPETTAAEETTIAGGMTAAEETTVAGGTTVTGRTTASETTGDVAQMPEGVPKFRDFFEEGQGNEPVQLQGASGSAGAIPAVKPFNFGRDPGGPEDKTLYITIPKLGLQSVPAFDEVSEEALKKGTAHIPATGYPWQEGANVYVAGHRLGYPETGSDRVFYDLDQLFPGDEIFVTDAAGAEYRYVVTEQVVVPPDNVEIMNPVPGKSLLSLQTCTLPDYADRIVVQAELVEGGPLA